MSVLNFFKNITYSPEVKKYSQLYDQLAKEHPNVDEKNLVLASCISGLLARVAYVDFHLSEDEVDKITQLIADWDFHADFDAKIIAELATDHIKEMAGLENHLYVYPLKEFLTKDQRYSILQSLFLVAASDGNVEAVESEEIRIIAKGLELSNQHFVVARSEVAKYLKALRN
ncbi:MAG: TerB family tellurite resistance protein [Bacteriovoracaceae bacterium]|nr:TerB family tellurite resistance protein [Bacteriovoracaceae bacterium]